MRWCRFYISGLFLTHLAEEGWTANNIKCVKGLPKDSKFIRSYQDMTLGIWIIVEHPEFHEVKEGDEIPEAGQILYEKI